MDRLSRGLELPTQFLWRATCFDQLHHLLPELQRIQRFRSRHRGFLSLKRINVHRQGLTPDADALIALGAEHGCEFSAEDLAPGAELSDQELDGVAGALSAPADADIALGVKDPQAVLQLNPRGRFSFSWKVEEGESLDGGLGDDD